MKAPNINIKDVLKKLSFLKNNLALLIPIIIVVVALLLFIPTSILGSRLRAKVEEQSVAMGKQVDRLAKDATSVTKAGEMEGYINAYAEDVNEVEKLIGETVKRELLSYNIFPDTNETSILLYENFGQAYRQGIEAMLDRMVAGDPPRDEDITEAMKSAPRPMMRPGQAGYGGGEGYGGMGMYGGGYGGGTSNQRSYRMMSPMQRKIADQICLDQARQAKVYASEADVAGYAYWDGWKFDNKDDAYKDCWYWQLGYWIIEDVTESIQAMNEDSENLLEAPIKRLMSLDFKMSRRQRRRQGPRGGAARTGNEDARPTYAIDTKNALTVPCTGRFTSEEKGIDVVQFSLKLIVNVDNVVPFMEQLCRAKTHTFRGFNGDEPAQTFVHNQISVLESSVEPIDLESRAHGLYRYGDLPVVQLDLLCEYVLPRTPQFEAIKPEQVKKELSGEEDEED